MSKEKEVLIEVSHLSRYYAIGKNQAEHRQVTKNKAFAIAVDDISFNLHRGEILGFLGPNGAGKSTTMKMLTGNLAPTHGQIKIAGVDLMDEPLVAKAKIGYLPDTPPLYKDLTVDEYLVYCGQLNRMNKSQIQQALPQVKDRCGLSDYGRRVINNLSKGYQQRVGIAQAIIHSPDIVILDEPTVGLDPIQMVEIRKLIKEIGKNHSVMLSSHILSEIQAICDNVQIIKQGQLVFHASIEQLTEQMQTHILRMSCTQVIDKKALLSIDGVDEIINLEQTEQTYTASIACHIEQQSELTVVAQKILAQAQQQQWGLYEIFAQQQSLEDIFMSLTRQTDADVLKTDSLENG